MSETGLRLPGLSQTFTGEHDMKIIETTRMFCGNLTVGRKFVCAVNKTGLGWNAEIVVSDNGSGEIIDSFIRDFGPNMKPSGVWRQMKSKAKERLS